MLCDRYQSDSVAEMLVPREAWHPYPRIDERAAWLGLRAPVRAACTAQAEKALGAAWPALPATLYLEFLRTGNRAHYYGPYAQRRRMLADEVLAECVEGQGRFLETIADGIWSVCEESTWCEPAHVNLQRAGAGLPDTAEPVLDLFVGETGAMLAWISYLLGGALDSVSPLIRPRIAREIDTRILTPFLTRDDFWWMGFLDHGFVNNWNPWINSNTLTCALLLEPDPVRRAAVVVKSLRSVDRFLGPHPADGGCDEGPGYWSRAAASLFECLELLHSATNGRIDVYDEPLVRNMGAFIYRAHIAERWFVNFADAAPRLVPDPSLVFRFGERVGDRAMQEAGAYFASLTDLRSRAGGGGLGRALPALFGLEDLLAFPARAPMPRDVWLPDIQVMLARGRAGTPDGLTVAVKGGHNAESHNHNDIGSFLVYAAGRPLLIDVGVGTYVRQTFSPERYEIWTMQSQYHNLPTVRGVMQKDGRAFRAVDVQHEANDRAASLCLDLAPAYPPEAGIRTWVRHVTLERGGAVTVEDRFELASATDDLVLTLMTPCAVSLTPGRIELGAAALPANERTGSGVVEFDAAAFTASCEDVVLEDPSLRSVWGESLRRILLRVVVAADTGRAVLRISE